MSVAAPGVQAPGTCLIARCQTDCAGALSREGPMSADIRRFLKRSPRRQPSASPGSHPAGGGADRNLRRLFAFVDRWAARSRIDEKLKRLEALDPSTYGSVATQIEAMVDEALATVPGRSGRPAATRIGLTWAIIALTIVIGLIAVGQYLATVIRR